MYKRDFGILFLSICGVYLSLQNEGTFTFRKAWFHEFPEALDALKDSPGVHPPLHLPEPVPADLNGDGKPEVLVASPDGHLLVLAPKRHGDGFAPALVLAEIDVGAIVGHDAPVHIAALAAGYTSSPPKELVRSLRKQVVAAVTTRGDVLVLDHNLKLVWHAKLADHFPGDNTHLQEVALLITEHAAAKGDKGMVIVGARQSAHTLADALDYGDVLDEEILAEGLERMQARGRKRAEGLDEVVADGGSSGRHFSYFAYDGGNGELRWKHEAQDFHKDLGSLQESTVTTQHGLHAAAEMQDGIHYGEASCREYREAVLAALPHSWHSLRDTRLHLSHFHRHRSHKGAQKAQLSSIEGQRKQWTADKDRPHARRQNSAPALNALSKATGKGRHAGKHSGLPPNVVVAHLEEGLEAIHLYSGRTVCRLPLLSHSLHVDLNGDGIPDHVHAVGGDPSLLDMEAAENDADRVHGHAHRTFCSVTVTSGIPPRQPLFNGTLCKSMHNSLKRSKRFGPVEVAPPVALPAPGKHGHYNALLVRQKSIAVFLTSRGELTSYSSDGKQLWQVFTGMYWQPTPEHSGSADDIGSEYGISERAVPTLLPLALRKHAIPSTLLVAGSDSASIVSEHGHELASFSLPGPPQQMLTTVDFNLDSYTDVILVSPEGLYAWAQVRRPGAVPFSALVGGLVVIMMAVFVTQQQGFTQQGTGKLRGRSTDRID